MSYKYFQGTIHYRYHFSIINISNYNLEGYSQNKSDIDLLLKPIEMTKKDRSLYEKMDDEIVLDTNLLQSLATDLITESNKVNKDVIGQIFVNIFLHKFNLI